jgi:uncharacterized membrane protein
MVIIAAAFVIRVFYSVACYLTPDEAAHFDAAAATSWSESMKAAFSLTHPPLFIAVLHAILFVGRSELIVRSPSLIAGTAALWFAFAWIKRLLGGVPALAGLGFLALSPMAISASAEVRQYGLLLFFICAALYATERTFAEHSTRWAILQGFFLLCAILTHYIALIVLASLGLYVLLRWLVDGLPRNILLTIGLSQLIIAIVFLSLYFGQVRKSIPFGHGSTLEWLRPFYYSAGSETPLGFAWRSVYNTFLHAVGVVKLSYLFMFLFMLGFAAVLAARTKAPRLVALLVMSPFVVGFVAGIFQVFPFGGSRHQTYLLPFLAAGIAAALACLPKGWTVPALVLGIAIAPHWLTRAVPDNNLKVDPLTDMTAAMQYVKQTIPPGAPIFVDYETRQVLRYYLARDESFPGTLQTWHDPERWYGGYRVIVPAEYLWIFRPDEVLDRANQSARALGAPPSDPLWVVSVAWADPSFASRLPSGQDRDLKQFGMISVIRFPAQTH